MKGMLVARRRVLFGCIVAVVAALAVFGVASGTPPTGPIAATPLGDANVANTATMDLNHIKFRTQEPVRVFHVKNVGGPGFSSGWHQHMGPVFIVVTAGSLTFYDRAGRSGERHSRAVRRGSNGARCRVTTVTAPGGYIETAGKPIQVLNTTPANVNGGSAEWITTQVIPRGAPPRVDVTPGFCGV